MTGLYSKHAEHAGLTMLLKNWQAPAICSTENVFNREGKGQKLRD